MEVLMHISQQLSNSTTLAYTPTEFTVSLEIAATNTLFFLSLALVLLDAFLAMLVKSWLHEFDRGWKTHTAPQRRAEEREQMFQGLKRCKLPQLIALLPILTQTSLLLFCIGLLVLIFPIHLISAIFSSLTLGAGFTLYWYTTCVSSFDPYAPFSSPISHGLKSLIKMITRPAQPIIPTSKTYFDIVERLFVTAEALEDGPVLAALLDQPVKQPLLWASDVEKWGKEWGKEWAKLVGMTLKFLGDPSTFHDSVARTITRNMPFWYDGGPTHQQLSQKLITHFHHVSPGQTGQHQGPNSLFAPYLSYCCGPFSNSVELSSPIPSLSSTIASLKPSDAIDGELFWMVNTIHKTPLWKSSQSFEFFSAVLVYVSSTHQSRRSKVPLTGAILHVMHSIRRNSIHSIKPYAPGSEAPIFDPINQPEPWSDDCSKIATYLLQPHKAGSGPCDDDVWKFQLALIIALYVDSTTKPVSSTGFVKLLNILDIPDAVIMSTSTWAAAYGQTNIAGYQYMALFKESLYQDGSHFRDIGYIVAQTIQRCSPKEIPLSAMEFLDIYIGALRQKATSTPNPLTRAPNGGSLTLLWSAHDNYPTSADLDPWILLHLDTAFPESSILREEDITNLGWNGTPKQDHIAKARLALYDSLKGAAKQLTPDLQLLNLFLLSKEYTVCTGAFEWRLELANTNPAMFDLETMGEELIKNLIQVLCRNSAPENDRSWKFLASHLTPKFTTLPLSWRRTFARVFLLDKPPAYQCFTKALDNQPEDFLRFLEILFELERASWGWEECNSLLDWLAKLPEKCVHHAANLQKKITVEVKTRNLAEDS